MILIFYRILFRLIAPVLGGLVWLRGLRGHEETGHHHERRGVSSLPRPAGKIIWVHAASVGEMRSVLPVVQTLLSKNPDLHCLITTVTVTAARLVRQTNHPRICHQYAPFDHPSWIATFLTHWQPDAVLWVESELWPTTLMAIKERGVPLVMINGRLSERSAKRWRYVPQTIGYILGLFDLCLAQSADDAARLKGLGARNLVVAGNMKYACAQLAYDPAMLDSLRAQIGNRSTVLFASTHEGEEEIAARAFKEIAPTHPGLLFIVMPRHPSRGKMIANVFDTEGLSLARRSVGQPITPATAIYLADTLGEPGLFFRLSPIVYMGNSLIPVPGGGHNPIEPAQVGCAIVYGHNMWNFPEIDADLRAAGGALMVRDEKNLAITLTKLLDDAALRQTVGQAAKTFVDAQNGVLDALLGQLQPYLERAKIAV